VVKGKGEDNDDKQDKVCDDEHSQAQGRFYFVVI
jgi:hypothetical protein